jgi:(p)ppGpp synthase/HD superfamily hydrolase
MSDRMYTHRVGEALRFAADAHAGQSRKGKPDEPYLSHILTVAGLVAHFGGDEDQIIAGVLHDAVEDAGGQERADEIRREFGDRVADIVLACSDAIPDGDGDKGPWKPRKLEYIARLRAGGDPDAVLVEACDKVANLYDIVEDLEFDTEPAFTKFNGGKQGTLEYYATLGEVLMPQVGVPALTAEYSRLLGRLQNLANVDTIRIWTADET